MVLLSHNSDWTAENKLNVLQLTFFRVRICISTSDCINTDAFNTWYIYYVVGFKDKHVSLMCTVLNVKQGGLRKIIDLLKLPENHIDKRNNTKCREIKRYIKSPALKIC